MSAEVYDLNLDEVDTNADWTKQGWDLPPYGTEEFAAWLEQQGLSLATFQRLPIYRIAVKRGIIRDGKWIGRPQEGG